MLPYTACGTLALGIWWVVVDYLSCSKFTFINIFT